ncbi:uncharacterized protein G2W53_035192 [Senna tora]|uniref:Uncharacterized protein n=1 Tax=Senna tora TaxID=362788 RepID=A0A834SR13_9FABA|nr:uncharacterized protein G2W53_035192 [Senna tora]
MEKSRGSLKWSERPTKPLGFGRQNDLKPFKLDVI